MPSAPGRLNASSLGSLNNLNIVLKMLYLMQLTLFLSARNIVSHIVTLDLKIFRQYCYTFYIMHTV
jgi:hypothetical protein